MPPAELSALLILATVTSFTPGPNTAMSTALAANRGLRGALHFVFAVPVGWGLLFTSSAMGLGALVQAMPLLRWMITLGGVSYLLWLAWRLWSIGQMSSAQPASLNVTFIQGVLLQFLNIKAWMLALSIAGGWIVGKADAQQRTLLILPVMLVFAFSSNFTYALLGSGLRHWLAKNQRLLAFNRTMALLLTATAIWMAWGQLQST